MEGHSHALVWTGSAASAVDLNRLLPPGHTDAEGNVVGRAGRGPSGDPANVHAVTLK